MSNEHKEKQWRNAIGIEATVQRDTLGGELSLKLNKQLNEIGDAMNPHPPGQMAYLGSIAVHIYFNETLGQISLVKQAGPTLRDCPERIALLATKDLIGSVMETYGHKRPTFRSGV